MIDKFGKPFTIVKPGISIKPYPSGVLTHPSMDALLFLMREHKLTAKDIKAGTILLTHAHNDHVNAVEGLLPELQQVNEGMTVQAQGAGQIREATASLKEGAGRSAASAREAHEASESLRDSIGRLQEDIALVPT